MNVFKDDLEDSNKVNQLLLSKLLEDPLLLSEMKIYEQSTIFNLIFQQDLHDPKFEPLIDEVFNVISSKQLFLSLINLCIRVIDKNNLEFLKQNQSRIKELSRKTIFPYLETQYPKQYEKAKVVDTILFLRDMNLFDVDKEQ